MKRTRRRVIPQAEKIAAMGQLEDYIRGVPLTEENAALMRGEEPAALRPAITSERQAKRILTGELTDEERKWLRRLYHDPGYEIFLKLLNSTVHDREESAKFLSSNDPFGNTETVIREWAYIACFKIVIRDMQALVSDNMSAI